MAKKSHDKGHTPKLYANTPRVQSEKSALDTGKASQQPTDLTDPNRATQVEKPAARPATTGVFQDQETGQSRGGTTLPQQQPPPLAEQFLVHKPGGEEAISPAAGQTGKPSLKADVRKPAAAPMSESSTPAKAEQPVRTADTSGSIHAAAEPASVVETTAPTKTPAATPSQVKILVSPAKVNEPRIVQEAVSKTVSPSTQGIIEPKAALSEAATITVAPAKKPTAIPKTPVADVEKPLTKATTPTVVEVEKTPVAPETPVAAVAKAAALTAASATGATAAQGAVSAAETVTVPSVERVREIAEPAKPPAEPRHEEPPYLHPPLHNKYLNKEALRHRFLLRQDFKPLIAYVGRLEQQKGVPLIRHGIFFALAQGAQFVLLGTSPDPRINAEFWHLKRQLNDHPDCHLELGYNEELAHLMYAGSDMIIMPSLYEPCGLTQLIALKYGTVPIVRAVGGLIDTVFDRDYSDKPYHERNGFVFHHAEAADLESAMRRAIGLWYSYPEEFRQLMINGMKYDYSWYHPAQHYLNIYEYIRCKQS